VSDLPRQRALVAEIGAGVIVQDAESAASALRNYALDPKRRADECRAALSWARQRESEGSPYDRAAECVEAVLRHG
jgi:hypothetical protein